METIEKHTSPDCFLRLVVLRDTDGDLAIGFEGFAWHTHGDILATLSGLPESQAIQQFIESIVGNKQLIAIARVDGNIRDVWPTDDPLSAFKYKPPEESIEFRLWNGQIVPVAEP